MKVSLSESQRLQLRDNRLHISGSALLSSAALGSVHDARVPTFRECSACPTPSPRAQ